MATETIKWICPVCGHENTEYSEPYPAIAECEHCGHAESNYQPKPSRS